MLDMMQINDAIKLLVLIACKRCAIEVREIYYLERYFLLIVIINLILKCLVDKAALKTFTW